MTDNSEIAGRLAALPDPELAGVLLVVTAERPGFAMVHAALLGLVESGDVRAAPDVSPDTSSGPTAGRMSAPERSGQVGGISGAPAGPVPPSNVPTPTSSGGYSSAGVPTFESVRDKVEQRFGTAQGMDELDRQTPAGRGVDEQWQAREKAARERLDRIRKSLRGNDIETHEP
ncbi:hypothetical protein AB0C34_27640 [Nocardia sp. NPDC049220]|uniref:PspA/IM30 family protein n=1 Tax=Nocardia sp. NPDC049220 TaxID=3155273 RepID=UPI0033C846DC